MISSRDIVSINELTLILKNISQCEVKRMTLPIKTVTSALKVKTYILTSIPASPIRFAAILEIMSVSTFITAVILDLHNK